VPATGPRRSVAWLLSGLLSAGGFAPVEAGCMDCHAAESPAADDPHLSLGTDCGLCHGGDSSAGDQESAHAGLRAFPGLLDNAEISCGGCHPAQVQSVGENLMHSGRGLVHITRFALGEHPVPGGPGDLTRLGDSPADSLLRKLCASCHLGQPKTEHSLDPVRDRGGGCLACHINSYPEPGHPALSARVEDARCFGCHSRSGRISLSYAGLAEIDPEALTRPDTRHPARLADGRLLEQRPPDLHHRAGLACIDCHTAVGLMGSGAGLDYASQAVDIQCSDCHKPGPTIGGDDWPQQHRAARQRIPYPITPGQRFLVTARNGTPLWNIRAGNDGNWLYPKLGGAPLKIPLLTPANHPTEPDHQRLSCQACHSQWAPQCYGCHIEYDPQGLQWDHIEGRGTPGAWHETRSLVRNDAPPLGVAADGRISPHVPGMILSMQHPDYPDLLFRRLFAPLPPHTSGSSRSCRDCHRNPRALGLGAGSLDRDEKGEWHFTPAHANLDDGLPADAWTSLDASRQGSATHAGHRPFSRQEMERLLDAGVD
jgi:hypothetical protein